MKTWVYVDGFNLYHGCVKDTLHKWLDLQQLCEHLLPGHQVERIKYFTARVRGRPDDPGLPGRQQVYLRALRTLPSVEIILGHFLETTPRMYLATPPATGPKTVQVRKMEEKGSDVNLAVHLLHDGHRREYEVGVVVSNDSDLKEAVRLVTSELHLPVGILCPYLQPSVVLAKYATFIKRVRSGALGASQFPTTLQDARGQFTKPASW